MANNSIPTGTKVVWYDWRKGRLPNRIGINRTPVTTGIVVAQSRQSDEVVIVEWDDLINGLYPVSIENVDDLIEIK